MKETIIRTAAALLALSGTSAAESGPAVDGFTAGEAPPKNEEGCPPGTMPYQPMYQTRITEIEPGQCMPISEEF